MKTFIVLIIGLAFGVVVFFASQLRVALASCNRTYQDSLDTLAAQAQTVFADKNEQCKVSYELLTDWELCHVRAESTTPTKFRKILSLVVSNYMLFFREKKKDISMLKVEHDERCKGVTDFMFAPPE